MRYDAGGYEDEYTDDEDDAETTYIPGREGKRKGGFFGGGKKPATKSTKQPKRTQVGGRWSGGRIGVLVLKVAIWLILAVFLINGFRAVFNPTVINVNQIAAAVAEYLGIEEFPARTGQPLAEQFARTYLANPEGDEQQRRSDLQALLPRGDADERALSLPQQQLLAGPYLVGPPEVVDPQRAIFTFRAQIIRESERNPDTGALSPRWVFLSVPVFADEDGAVRIGGLPAFVPGPAFSKTDPGIKYPRDEDIEASIETDMNTFFEAWAAGDERVLNRFVSADPNVVTAPIVTEGLSASPDRPFVVFDSIAAVQAEAPPAETTYVAGDTVLSEIRVVWLDNGTPVEQSYLVNLIYKDGQTWYVQDLQGGSFMG